MLDTQQQRKNGGSRLKDETIKNQFKEFGPENGNEYETEIQLN